MLSFLFPSHLPRLAYFVRLILVESLIGFCLTDIMNYDHWNSNRLTALAGMVVFIVYAVAFIFLPRLRDCGVPAWTLIFALIPIASALYGLILMFAPTRSLRFSGTKKPALPQPPPVIPGNKCMACGKSLALATDGVVNSYGGVLCNECNAAAPAPSAKQE